MQSKTRIPSSLKFLLWGVVLYTIAYNILWPINKLLGHGAGIIGIVFAFYFYASTIKTYIGQGKSIKIHLYLFIFYALVVILRGLLDNGVTSRIIIDFITQKRSILGYLTPLVLLYSVRFKDIKNVYRICYYASWIAIFFVLINFKEIFLTSHVNLLGASWEDTSFQLNLGQIPGYFVLPSSLILLSYKFMPKKYLSINNLAFILSLGTSISYGRRSFVAFHLIIVVLWLLTYLSSNKTRSWKKSLIILGIIILIFSISFFMSNLSLFEIFSERLGADTRSGVEEYFSASFKGKPNDWIFGRGIFGKYYCPIASISEDQNYRTVIETGYMQFILNGGLIILALYVFILLRAVYLGFFRSNNALCKALALFLLASLLFLRSGNSLEFTLKGVMIWLAVTICYSKAWRLKLLNKHLLNLKTLK